MEIIYQNDAIHMDGRLNVADAVSNIIDVNVDQVKYIFIHLFCHVFSMEIFQLNFL